LTLPKPLVHYRTLQEYHNRAIFQLLVANVEGNLQPLLCPYVPTLIEDTSDRILASDLVDIDLPHIKASDIELIYNKAQDCYDLTAEKVLLHGREHFLKTGYEDDLQREIRSLWRIQNVPVLKGLRVPKMQSLVELDDGSVVGALLRIIDIKYDLFTAQATKTKTFLDDRKKWLAQIKNIVAQLHDAGICWGDVHPGNVVVDNNGDAWVIDFRGGFMSGFVSSENNDTMAGDLEGISNLANYMGIEGV
jgi:serine/threonine protein kinase